jgi:hypothetical protein
MLTDQTTNAIGEPAEKNEVPRFTWRNPGFKPPALSYGAMHATDMVTGKNHPVGGEETQRSVAH